MNHFGEEDDLPRENPQLNLLPYDYVSAPVLDLPSAILPTQLAIPSPKLPCTSCSSSSNVMSSSNTSLPLCNTQSSDRMEQFLTTLLKQNEQILKLQEQMAGLLMRKEPSFCGRGQGSVYFYEEKRVERSIIDRNNGTTAQSVGVVTNRVVGNPVSEELKRQLKEEILAELRQGGELHNANSFSPTEAPRNYNGGDYADDQNGNRRKIASMETSSSSAVIDPLLAKDFSEPQEATEERSFPAAYKQTKNDENCDKSRMARATDNCVRSFPQLEGNRDPVRLPPRSSRQRDEIRNVASPSQKVRAKPPSTDVETRRDPRLQHRDSVKSPEFDSHSSILTLGDLRLDTIDEQTSIIQEPVVVDIEDYVTSDSEDESGFKESEKEFGQALNKVKNIIEQRKQVSFVPLPDGGSGTKASPNAVQQSPFRRIRKQQPPRVKSAPMTPIRKATFERVRELGASFVETPAASVLRRREDHNKANHNTGPSEVSIAMARLSRKYSLQNELREETVEHRRYAAGPIENLQRTAGDETNLSISTRQYLEKYGLLK